jgi:tRNA threonylcarbamoyladenosine biosynthesis protein TsaE
MTQSADDARLTVHLSDEDATLRLGAQLAAGLSRGLKIYLSGDLGAGKTTLARGLLRGLGYEGRVKSPTYTLMELYKLPKLCLYHFDFYRLKEANEWQEAGFRESFAGTAVCLVEWPEQAQDLLPEPDLWIRLEHSAHGRLARIEALTKAGARCIRALRS